MPSLGSASASLASDFDQDQLDDDSENQNADEEGVVEEAGKDIVFLVTKLSRVDFIEHLHEDKAVENKCIVLGFNLKSDWGADRSRVIAYVE